MNVDISVVSYLASTVQDALGILSCHGYVLAGVLEPTPALSSKRAKLPRNKWRQHICCAWQPVIQEDHVLEDQTKFRFSHNAI